MRYALAQRLATLPTETISERHLDLVDAIVRGLQTDGERVGATVGDPYMGYQMAMRLSPGGISIPSTVERAEYQGYRAAAGQLEAMAEAAPRQIRGVDFGWVPEGQPLSNTIYYAQPQTAAGKRFAMTQNYSPQLRALLPALQEKAGMRPGDVLFNQPRGMGQLDEMGREDFRRAKKYMRQGFGVPHAYTHDQMAKLMANGKLDPVQLFMADQDLVGNLGWKRQAPTSMSNAPIQYPDMDEPGFMA